MADDNTITRKGIKAYIIAVIWYNYITDSGRGGECERRKAASRL